MIHFRHRSFLDFVVLTLTLAFGSVGFGLDCGIETTKAAQFYAQEENGFYNCVSLSVAHAHDNEFAVEMVCSSDSGNHHVVVSVMFQRPSICTDAVVKQISVD